jgi:hypothetical protein
MPDSDDARKHRRPARHDNAPGLERLTTKQQMIVYAQNWRTLFASGIGSMLTTALTVCGRSLSALEHQR